MTAINDLSVIPPFTLTFGIAEARLPTERPEADGTFAWRSTTLLLVEVAPAGETGLGFSYIHAAAARLVNESLAPLIERRNALDIAAAADMLKQQLRNLGHPGLGMDALSAIDIALWDLKARLLGFPS